MTAATENTVSRMTLPTLAMALPFNLDILRRKFRVVPELAGMIEEIGGFRFVRADRIPEIRRILGVAAEEIA